MTIPLWIEAGLWGTLAGSALLLGAFVGYRYSLPKFFLAGIMALGSGVLISALSFELLIPAYEASGQVPVLVGFLTGALIYSGSNYLMDKRSARRRQSSELSSSGNGTEDKGSAIALGSVLDGIPESMAIGLTVVSGSVSMAAVVAIFLSNIPEGISSSASMKAAGKSKMYIFGIWAAIALISGLAAAMGYSLCHHIPLTLQAGMLACAAGAILTMLADTMIPEAYEGSSNWSGILVCLGFMAAFVLSVSEG